MRAILCGVALVLIASNSWAQSQPSAAGPRKDPEKQKTSTCSQARQIHCQELGTEQRPIFVETLKTPPTQDEREKDIRDRTDQASYERWMIGTGFATVVVLVFQGVGLFWQVLTSRRQLRAYVSVSPGSLDLPNQGKGNRYALNLAIRNGGQTPAYQVLHNGVIRVHPLPLPDNFKFSIPPPPKLRAQAAVGPGEESPAYIAAEDILPSILIAQGSAPVTTTLYCYGTVKYLDVFKRRHTTRFCFFFVTRDDGKTVVVTTRQHNDAN